MDVGVVAEELPFLIYDHVHSPHGLRLRREPIQVWDYRFLVGDGDVEPPDPQGPHPLEGLRKMLLGDTEQ